MKDDMRLLIISDLHLGRGKFLKNGQTNILEDFVEDDLFVEFVKYYSQGSYQWESIHLVLNGDILNLIQIDIDGVFDHIIDAERSARSIEIIQRAHPTFFTVLKEFLATPNKKLTYVIGNHDAGMAFPLAQEKFSAIVGGPVDFVFELETCGVHIEHGHRFEVINTVPPTHYFIDGPHGKKILNLPWGSLFCINVLPKLRKERPYIDKIRPMSSYVSWCFLHDFMFFWKMAYIVIWYFIKSSFENYTKQNRNFKTTFNVLKQYTMYPKYAQMAKRILQLAPHLHTVIMGHTHVLEWRRFPEDKYYFNTGTWNSIPSVDAGLHEHTLKLSYIIVELDTHNDIAQGTSLNEWQGNWRPYKNEVNTNG